MAKFITTSEISANLEKIISTAEKNLILLSPYLKLSSSIAQSLIAASDKCVQIRLVYGKGKEKLKVGDRRVLNLLHGVKLYYLEKLHAKCYFNEEDMIITSMNLHEYSQRNNNEFGILINRTKDKELFENAFRESLAIIEQVTPENIEDFKLVSKKVSNDNTFASQLFKLSEHASKKVGTCISCSKTIPLNLHRPFCFGCYNDWIADSEFNEYELYCHTCGDSWETTINKPQCIHCYKSGKILIN